jgi:hypothetical protein
MVVASGALAQISLVIDYFFSVSDEGPDASYVIYNNNDKRHICYGHES